MIMTSLVKVSNYIDSLGLVNIIKDNTQTFVKLPITRCLGNFKKNTIKCLIYM